MIIRKLFKFEAGHVVRGCNSDRCKYSEHGHSYKVEVFFQSDTLTSYGMIIDFGDLKKVKDLIDRFDHSYHFWSGESEEFKAFHKKNDKRWVQLPFNASAENYAIYFLKLIIDALKTINPDNKRARCIGVRVHETDTGYAESCLEDVKLHGYYKLEDIVFSEDCLST